MANKGQVPLVEVPVEAAVAAKAAGKPVVSTSDIIERYGSLENFRQMSEGVSGSTGSVDTSLRAPTGGGGGVVGGVEGARAEAQPGSTTSNPAPVGGSAEVHPVGSGRYTVAQPFLGGLKEKVTDAPGKVWIEPGEGMELSREPGALGRQGATIASAYLDLAARGGNARYATVPGRDAREGWIVETARPSQFGVGALEEWEREGRELAGSRSDILENLSNQESEVDTRYGGMIQQADAKAERDRNEQIALMKTTANDVLGAHRELSDTLENDPYGNPVLNFMLVAAAGFAGALFTESAAFGQFIGGVVQRETEKNVEAAIAGKKERMTAFQNHLAELHKRGVTTEELRKHTRAALLDSMTREKGALADLFRGELGEQALLEKQHELKLSAMRDLVAMTMDKTSERWKHYEARTVQAGGMTSKQALEMAKTAGEVGAMGFGMGKTEAGTMKLAGEAGGTASVLDPNLVDRTLQYQGKTYMIPKTGSPQVREQLTYSQDIARLCAMIRQDMKDIVPGQVGEATTRLSAHYRMLSDAIMKTTEGGRPSDYDRKVAWEKVAMPGVNNAKDALALLENGKLFTNQEAVLSSIERVTKERVADQLSNIGAREFVSDDKGRVKFAAKPVSPSELFSGSGRIGDEPAPDFRPKE